MKPFLNLQSVSQTEKIIFDLPVLSAESVLLEQALGRRLAESFYAPQDLPGFCRSTMDGYAVFARDVFGASETSPALLSLKGDCRMGKMPDFTLESGEAAPMLTGAPLPENADAVVMIEHTRPVGASEIEITRSVAPGMNIVQADEDAQKGSLLIDAGKQLRPQEIGILAAFGIKSVKVTRKPRVAIISTGDEVRPLEDKLEPGQVYDVNSYSIECICKDACALPERRGIIGDNPLALTEAIASAASEADVVVISGGSSAGMRDHTVESFLAMPSSRLLVHGVAISPGKPFILAVSGSVILMGLPGHVSGALVCAHVFLGPLLNHLQGQSAQTERPWFDATLSRPIASAQGRRDYIRCRLQKDKTGFIAIPLVSPSAVIRGLVQADGYIVCPETSEGFSMGDRVRVYPL